MFGIAALLAGCKTEEEVKESAQSFNYVVDHFADVEIMRYQVDNWVPISSSKFNIRQSKSDFMRTVATLLSLLIGCLCMT